MAEKTNKPKRPEPARTYPESDVWTPPGENPEEIEIDHPVYRKAKPISLGIGAIAALAVVVFTDTPWWMPILTFAVIAAIVYRILRPRMRHPSIEDEI